MTDPIEQARARFKAGLITRVPPDQLLAEFEQAILHHHPDVVRLVLAARATVAFNRKKGSPLGDYGPTADLDPFKEVQE